MINQQPENELDASTFYAFALSFAAEHPFLTWCALWLGWVPYYIVKHTYRLIMVSLRGWPPVHLDADGDWKRETEAETKTETVTSGDMSHTVTTKKHTGPLTVSGAITRTGPPA